MKFKGQIKQSYLISITYLYRLLLLSLAFFFFNFSLLNWAKAHQTKKNEITHLVENIIQLNQISLTNLVRLGAIREVEPNVYTGTDAFLNGKKIYKDHEFRSIVRLAKILNKPILFTEHLAGHIGILGVDAVLFNRSGVPEINVSIKTKTQQQKNVAEGVLNQRKRALESLSRLHDVNVWGEFWNLQRSAKGEWLRLTNNKGHRTSKNQYKVSLFFRKLLGLDEGRSTLVFFDLEKAGDISIARVKERSLRFYNGDVDESSIEYPKLLHFDFLDQDFSQYPFIDAYVLLTTHSFFYYSSTNFHLINIQSGCTQALDKDGE